MNAFRFRGVTRRLLAGFVAVLAVALCLGVLSTPSWAEEPATSQVKVDASSQVERSVDVVSPDPASGSDTDISRTDVADGATDSAAPEPDASSQQAFIGEAASSEDAGASSQMFPAGSSVTSDPSQVPEYDVAADAEPEGSSAPMGYDSAGDSAANAPVAYSATVYSGDWSYYESKDDSGNTVYVLDGYYGSASSITLPAKLDGKQQADIRCELLWRRPVQDGDLGHVPRHHQRDRCLLLQLHQGLQDHVPLELPACVHRRVRI